MIADDLCRSVRSLRNHCCSGGKETGTTGFQRRHHVCHALHVGHKSHGKDTGVGPKSCAASSRLLQSQMQDPRLGLAVRRSASTSLLKETRFAFIRLTGARLMHERSAEAEGAAPHIDESPVKSTKSRQENSRQESLPEASSLEATLEFLFPSNVGRQATLAPLTLDRCEM